MGKFLAQLYVHMLTLTGSELVILVSLLAALNEVNLNLIFPRHIGEASFLVRTRRDRFFLETFPKTM